MENNVNNYSDFSLANYKSTDNIIEDVKAIIEHSQNNAYGAVNTIIIRKN
ncbi:MAG: hypothetical protein LUG60_06510 [Erysipelotrichaceae bacterium]|nr:hypothetical protein [Erysipelotrichaceae bacterium]